MALGIGVSGNALIGYTITVSGFGSNDRVTVVRHDSTNYYALGNVRGADFATVTVDPMVFVDYEAPLNISITYEAQAFFQYNPATPNATATSSSQLTTVPLGFAILTQVADPTQKVAGMMTDLKTWAYQSRILGTYNVLNRRNPVLVTDIQSSRTGSFDMANVNVFPTIDYTGSGAYAYGAIVEAKWSSIFASGSTCLLRSDYARTGFDDMYFMPSAVTSNRLTRVGATSGSPIINRSISYIEVDRPLTGSGVHQFGWGVVRDSNANWTEVMNQHVDWTDVMNNPSV